MFESTHKLEFFAAAWADPEFTCFKIGTCQGLYVSTSETYDIIAVVNNEPGNGHFQDVIDWFENSCLRDKKSLRFMEMMNDEFRKHLVLKRGYKPEGENNLIKTFKKIKNSHIPNARIR